MKVVVEIPDEWVESGSTESIEKKILRLLAVERFKSLSLGITEEEEQEILAELDALKPIVREELQKINSQIS
jgi:hypothetical protein